MPETWKLPRPAGVCAATNRAIAPGDVYWTAVTVKDGLFVRREYAEDAWNDSLKESAFSSWRARVPAPDAPPEERLVDDEVILDFFRRLEGCEEESKINFRYVLGLLLVRKKIFKMQDIVRDGDREIMLLKEKGVDETHRVEAPALSPEAMMQVRDQVRQIMNMGEEEDDPAA